MRFEGAEKLLWRQQFKDAHAEPSLTGELSTAIITTAGIRGSVQCAKIITVANLVGQNQNQN